jgi:hypothetical protein
VALMNKAPLAPERIARNDAVEIVGKAIFGDGWVGAASPEEWELAQKYKGRFADGTKVPANIADQVYEAEERLARSDRQNGEAILWLENRGLDCIRGLNDGFERKEFEALFTKAFGQAPSGSMSSRDQAVLKRLRAGKRPGENEYWNVFRSAVEADMAAVDGEPGEGTSIKQLRRIVKHFRKQHGLK